MLSRPWWWSTCEPSATEQARSQVPTRKRVLASLLYEIYILSTASLGRQQNWRQPVTGLPGIFTYRPCKIHIDLLVGVECGNTLHRYVFCGSNVMCRMYTAMLYKHCNWHLWRVVCRCDICACFIKDSCNLHISNCITFPCGLTHKYTSLSREPK